MCPKFGDALVLASEVCAPNRTPELICAKGGRNVVQRVGEELWTRKVAVKAAATAVARRWIAASGCLLPVACCLLPVACCLLPGSDC